MNMPSTGTIVWTAVISLVVIYAVNNNVAGIGDMVKKKAA